MYTLQLKQSSELSKYINVQERNIYHINQMHVMFLGILLKGQQFIHYNKVPLLKQTSIYFYNAIM